LNLVLSGAFFVQKLQRVSIGFSLLALWSR
jgi:hypothetical protein